MAKLISTIIGMELYKVCLFFFFLYNLFKKDSIKFEDSYFSYFDYNINLDEIITAVKLIKAKKYYFKFYSV